MIRFILFVVLVFLCMYGNIIINILKQKYGLGSVQRKPGPKKQKEHPDICKAAAVNASRLGVSDLEDRENDWLARQLKEEARLKKKMFSNPDRFYS